MIHWITGSIRKPLLRRRALRSRDEGFRLAAARQLQDESLLRQIALEACCASIRKEAAALIRQQPFLAAIALSAWDLDLGLQVVDRIRYELLLQRVARSARQDAIRLAAAKKLNQPKLIKKIACATPDLSLRWEAACYLNDPELMADVALFKPGHKRMDSLRSQARSALLNYLNALQREMNVNALLSFILIQKHLPFKLQAFLRLPDEAVQISILQHLARQDFSYIEPNIIRRVLSKINGASWYLEESARSFPCTHCKGKGVLSLKSVTAVLSCCQSESLACPECGGTGEIFWQLAVCRSRCGAQVDFKLPLSCGDLSSEEYTDRTRHDSCRGQIPAGNFKT